jgi:hypothetical protein
MIASPSIKPVQVADNFNELPTDPPPFHILTNSSCSRVSGVRGWRLRFSITTHFRARIAIASSPVKPAATSRIRSMTDWFERLTGFREGSYQDTRRRLAVDGHRLRSTVNRRPAVEILQRIFEPPCLPARLQEAQQRMGPRLLEVLALVDDENIDQLVGRGLGRDERRGEMLERPCVTEIDRFTLRPRAPVGERMELATRVPLGARRER